MSSRLAALLAHLALRRPVATLLVLALLTGLAGWRAQRLSVEQDQLKMLPKDLPSVRATRRAQDLLGGVGLLTVALRSTDAGHLKTVGDDLAERLRQLPEVRDVQHRLPVHFVRDRVALFVETEELAAALDGLRRFVLHDGRTPDATVVSPRLIVGRLLGRYRAHQEHAVEEDYAIDAKGQMLLLSLKPNGHSTDLKFLERLVATVRATIDRYGAQNRRGAKLREGYDGNAQHATVTWGLTGAYQRNLDDSRAIMAALGPTSLAAGIGVLVLLLLLLRNPALVGVLLGPLLIGVAFSYAFCELVFGRLNTVTLMLGAVQGGMGIEYGIHLITRVRHEDAASGDVQQALRRALEHTTPPALASALTSAAVLALLAVADFEGFSQFGIIMAFGILTTFVLMFLAIPLQLGLLAPRWPWLRRSLRPLRPAAPAAEGGAFPAPRPVLGVALVVTVVLAIAATRVRFDYDCRNVMAADTPAIRLQQEIDRRFRTSAEPVVIHTPTFAEAEALYEQLERRPGTSRIRTVTSVLSLVPPRARQLANRALLDELQAFLAGYQPPTEYARLKLAQLEPLAPFLRAQPFTIDDLPVALREPFLPLPASGATGFLTYLYPRAVTWDARLTARFAAEAGTIRVGDRTYEGGGMPVIYADIAQVVIRDGRRMAVLAILAAALIVLLLFRRVTAAALVCMPLVVGMACMLGVMALVGWRLNYFNILVLPVVFGTALDAGVYLVERHAEGGSVLDAVRTTGAASAWTSLTTAVGWGALVMSSHRGLISMGILACVGIAASLLLSLTALPAILELLARRRRPVA
jgi:uncharacterized protein